MKAYHNPPGTQTSICKAFPNGLKRGLPPRINPRLRDAPWEDRLLVDAFHPVHPVEDGPRDPWDQRVVVAHRPSPSESRHSRCHDADCG